MKPQRAFVFIVALIALQLWPQAHALEGIALEIEKHARLNAAGAMIISVNISCGPFAGVLDFQEGFAGGFQEKTGAEAEGGIDIGVVCDGVERTHSAHLFSFAEAGFKRGPASAGVTLFVCMLVGDDQICHTGSTHRRVIIAEQLVP